MIVAAQDRFATTGTLVTDSIDSDATGGAADDRAPARRDGQRLSRFVHAQAELVGELAAGIAHEVRNPLAGIKGAIEVLRAELDAKPSNVEIVDEVLAQIVRLEGLVRDLLSFAHPRPLARSRFDLHELLDRVLRVFKEDADRAGVTVLRSYGPGTARLWADREQIEQVFLNLTQNAVQAMENGGRLTVSTRRDGDRLSITFQDTGKGIPPRELTRVLQPFFTTKHRGSGLGLAIVKQVVEAHGGDVEISSGAGEGTTAALTLPVVETP